MLGTVVVVGLRLAGGGGGVYSAAAAAAAGWVRYLCHLRHSSQLVKKQFLFIFCLFNSIIYSTIKISIGRRVPLEKAKQTVDQCRTLISTAILRPMLLP